MPTVGKLERYLARLLRSPGQTQLLMSVSAADATLAQPYLTNDLAGVPVIHFPEACLQATIRRALDAIRSPREPGLAHPTD